MPRPSAITERNAMRRQRDSRPRTHLQFGDTERSATRHSQLVGNSGFRTSRCTERQGLWLLCSKAAGTDPRVLEVRLGSGGGAGS